jgi:hypothetical protein
MALQLFKIASTTVETPQSSITFSSIPQGYTDLIILSSLRTDRASAVRDITRIQFNGDTSTNYSNKELYGTGSAASSASETGQTGARCGYPTATSATLNTFSNDVIYIPNYTSSNAKSFSADSTPETNATAQDTVLIAGLWSGTSAINSIKLYPQIGTAFIANTTATLYGVL